jgi:cytochrome c oxidase assembly factor CtaG
MPPMFRPGPIARFTTAAAGTIVAGALAATPVSAHGPVPDSPPSAATLLLGWTFPPLPTLAILVSVVWWAWATRRVNAAHPDNPVPRVRTLAFVAAMAALAFALLSGIERYDTTLFSVHMVQHLLLTMVAAPLIAIAAPITLILRLSAPDARRRVVLPVLHSRAVRFLAFPVIAWLAFAVVMWGAHFSPLFDLALENPLAHDLEHALFLGTALLFWWPVAAADPSPSRLAHPSRTLYTFLQMPQNTFLAVIILGATVPLYEHYASLQIPWPGWTMTALDDQRLAAGIMWVGGDLLFITAVAAVVWGWMRAEEADTARADRRADAELAAIRAREAALAERRAEEAGSAKG